MPTSDAEPLPLNCPKCGKPLRYLGSEPSSGNGDGFVYRRQFYACPSDGRFEIGRDGFLHPGKS